MADAGQEAALEACATCVDYRFQRMVTARASGIEVPGGLMGRLSWWTASGMMP